MPIISTSNLSKKYRVPIKEPGLLSSVKSVLSPRFEERVAVSKLNLSIEPGELIGVLGPNGAGKTTLMKMLAGILHPTDGTCQVLGFEPWKRKIAFQRQIATVMGQKNTLWWDLPAQDSFLLLQEIYELNPDTTRTRVGVLAEILGVTDLLTSPVRNLSLGERMKMEIIAGILHSPQVLFLDEPSIGLDVGSQRAIREFIKEENEASGTTILLTSHYMQDIEALCKRVIVIHAGQAIFDGRLSDLVSSSSLPKIAKITFDPAHPPVLHATGTVLQSSEGEVTIEIQRENIPVFIAALGGASIIDVNLQDLPIERIIEGIFTRGVANE